MSAVARSHGQDPCRSTDPKPRAIAAASPRTQITCTFDNIPKELSQTFTLKTDGESITATSNEGTKGPAGGLKEGIIFGRAYDTGSGADSCFVATGRTVTTLNPAFGRLVWEPPNCLSKADRELWQSFSQAKGATGAAQYLFRYIR
uniref:Uncharacterized protein n=1 Tax=Kwoniella dejecticola CBS 10117 TaxID=1296121 RepID=A0A1A6A869_9TREE|nr:uncharacterized protein I303_03973 [Kwoniella dejecticola CBS 10117]OBR86252.1 hypothetical protein I303_03973 [Kwoniella dejecticola CBS 10117]